ncbi:MAG: ribosome maturation factor RimM [Ktedonobacterales bacterium]
MSQSPNNTPTPPQADDQAHSDGAARVVASEWALIGVVSGVFGVKGVLKVHPENNLPEHFVRLKTVYLGADHIPYQVVSVSEHKRQLLLHLVGVGSPTDAARLRGRQVFIPAIELPPLPPDQFYVHDLIGLRVRHVNGQPLGVISDVLATGASDIYVVRNETTGAEVMLPAVKEFVAVIDLTAGEVRVTPIPGLFDEDFDEAR